MAASDSGNSTSNLRRIWFARLLHAPSRRTSGTCTCTTSRTERHAPRYEPHVHYGGRRATHSATTAWPNGCLRSDQSHLSYTYTSAEPTRHITSHRARGMGKAAPGD